MDTVYSGYHGSEITATEFNMLSVAEMAAAKLQLTCLGCEEVSWFSRPSQYMSAHFRSHHNDECEIPAGTVAEEEGSSGDVEDVLNIDLGQSNSGLWAPVPNVQSEGGGQASSRYGGVIPVARRSRTSNGSLLGLLKKLVSKPEFRQSSEKLRLRIPRSDDYAVDGAISDVVFGHEELDDVSEEAYVVIWGTAVSINPTADHGLWINFNTSLSKGFSIKIPEEAIEDFCKLYDIADPNDSLELESLEGSHVLVVGRLFSSGRGKPYVICGNPEHYLVMRKYR
jgi:hypothetical protein